MRRTATFAIGVVVGVVLWGTALAAIPDSGGVIHGCYRTGPPSQGLLRVIDTEAGQTCTNNEVGLPWNQTGPQGATGAAGTSLLRFRSDTQVPPEGTTVTLGTWTQPANVLNIFVGGQAAEARHCNTPVNIFVDGVLRGQATASFPAGPAEIRFAQFFGSGYPALFEPGVTIEHTMTAFIDPAGCNEPVGVTVSVDVEAVG